MIVFMIHVQILKIINIYIAKKDYNPDYSWYEKILEFIGLYNKIEYDYLNQEN